MLTVIAIDESLMRQISEFESLLTSASYQGSYRICAWDRKAKTLPKAIPALFDREFISEEELLDWNILIVSDNRECFADNVFSGTYIPGTNNEQLADPQLNELAKMLGVIPVSTTVVTHRDQNGFSKDIKVDTSFRDALIEKYYVEGFTRPGRIYLMSVQKDYDVEVESFFNEQKKKIAQVSSFADEGLYPSNCRFFQFRLSSVSNNITTRDYFRLWMTMMILAYNDGADAFQFEVSRLYSIDADIDTQMIGNQINRIYSRVHHMKNNLLTRIKTIRNLRETHGARRVVMPNLNVNIFVKYSTDESGLMLDEKQFGLTKDCPTASESYTFSVKRIEMERKIRDYLYTPKKALEKAVEDTKQNGVYVNREEGIFTLTKEQRDGLQRDMDQLELEFISTKDVDIEFEQNYEKSRDAQAKEILFEMRKRSSKKAVIIGSVVMFAICFLSFLPYVLGQSETVRTGESFLQSLLLSLGIVAVLGLAGMVCLLVLNKPLKRAFFHFRKLMKAFIKDVHDMADVYSQYLSRVASFMKMNSFDRHCRCNVQEYKLDEERKLQNNVEYCSIIEDRCTQWAQRFNFKLIYDKKQEPVVLDLDEAPEQNVLYAFINNVGEYRLEYNHTEAHLYSPYPFVKSLNVSSQEVFE